MCHPAAFAAVAGAGGVVSAAGAYQQGRATMAYYDSVASQKDTAAKLAEKSGDMEQKAIVDQAATESKMIRERADAIQGAQTAAFAASGIGSGSKTAEQLTLDSFDREQADLEALRYNADQRLSQSRNNTAMQAWQLRSESAMARSSSANTRAGLGLAVAGSLLGGASSAGQSYMAASGKGR